MVKLNSRFFVNIVNFTQQFVKFDIHVKKKDCLNWYLTSVYFAKSVLKYRVTLKNNDVERHGTK